MKIVEQNKLELSFVALVAEQCWSGTSALLSNQSHQKLSSLFYSKLSM